MNLAYPYDIDGEIRYKDRVFQVGVRKTVTGGYEITVFEYHNGSREEITQFHGDMVFIGTAFGSGVSFIEGYVGGGM